MVTTSFKLGKNVISALTIISSIGPNIINMYVNLWFVISIYFFVKTNKIS